MPGYDLVIKTNGLPTVTAHLEATITRAQNLRVPMKAGAQLMMFSVNANFGSGGRPNRWATIAASTRKYKMRQGLSMTPLTGRTGALKGSISPKVTSDSFSIGTSIPYGAIHQFGGVINQGARSELFQRNRYLRGSRAGSFKRGTKSLGPNRVGFGFRARGFNMGARTINIPARPYLVFQDQDVQDINKIVTDYIKGKSDAV